MPTTYPPSSSVAGAPGPLADLDASANPNYPSAAAGDRYRITVAGKIGGASGKVVEAGDVVEAIAANAGGTEAAVGTSWIVMQANIAGMTSAGLSMITAANAAAQAALLPAAVGDSGSGGTKGLVPAPAAGDAAAVKFLKADGTWAVPAGGSSISDPNVGYIRSDGNDTTGTGAPGAPVLTWQKAYDLGFRVFDFGVGSFGGLLIPGNPGSDVYLTLRGRGYNGSLISQVGSLTIESQNAVNIYLTLDGMFADAINNSPVKADSLLAGGNAGILEIHALGRSVITGAYSNGGEGGDGDAEVPSGSGGVGGTLSIIGPVVVSSGVGAWGGAAGLGGGGFPGADGTILLREMCSVLMPSPAPTVIGAIIDGVFVAV